MLPNKKKYCEDLINFLQNENLLVGILFVSKEKVNNSYEVYKVNISDAVATNLRKTCYEIGKKSYGKPENKTFKPYNPAQKGSDCTEFLDGEELEQIEPMLNMLKAEVLELKKIDDKFLSRLWYYVIKLDDGNKQILFYKKYSKGKVLTKGFWLALTFREGNFDILESNVFIIEDKADCILFDNKLIIRSKGNFEKIFDFFYKIKENAESAIELIEGKLPFEIENLEGVKSEWMRHEPKMRKLNNIYASRTLEKIQPKNIELLVEERILKNTTFTKREDGKLIISSKDPWELLNILDDDYVKSRLTGIDYEATTHKKEIKR